ncbi:MAG: AraC family transcriptional regulator [Gammaproteobacteria bacterium]|nr:AraC family transcriptional regulator [Gammaproteobacteria bacterium]
MKTDTSIQSAADSTLASLVSDLAQTDGDYTTPIPAIMLYRRNAVTDPMPCIYGLGLGLAVQGGKRVTLSDEIFDYGPGQSLLNSVDLSVVSYVTKVTHEEPFRAVTNMSPLQYLKNLRLQDARQWMLNEDMDASSAAVRVGYESASQFSREYARLFGAPPLRDVKRIKPL